jgi:c-di-GMP-binding flagellar brake protein YcgR
MANAKTQPLSRPAPAPARAPATGAAPKTAQPSIVTTAQPSIVTTARPTIEHRRHPRVEVRMSAEVRTDQSAFTATTRDLSEGGAGLETNRPLAEGQEIALGLFLVIDDLEDEAPPLWVKARVAWAGETDDGQHSAGVRFTAITPEQRTWLRQVMTHIKQPDR